MNIELLTFFHRGFNRRLVGLPNKQSSTMDVCRINKIMSMFGSPLALAIATTVKNAHRHLISASVMAALSLGLVNNAQADYLGTDNLRIYPTNLDGLFDGYDIGDKVEFLIEVVPRDTGSDSGNAAWSTFYIPAGTKVVGVSYVRRNTLGQLVKSAADDVDATYDGWGARNAAGYGAGLGEGYVNEVQQDTGVFYSTDPRTAQQFSLGTVDGTGVPVTNVYNQWDKDQTQAFGEGSAYSGNGGSGNTPIHLATNAGTGSPVAGPDAYYTNDYNPANSGCTVMTDDPDCYSSVGPWQRIEILGDKIGGSGPVMAATAAGLVANTSVDATGGALLDPELFPGVPATLSLPAGTNAVRIVHGARRLGDLERWALTLEITDPVPFVAALDANEVCADSVPADTTPAKDNNWRYYEVSRSCTDLDTEAVLVKEMIDPAAGSVVHAGETVIYEFTFTNISQTTLTNVVATDEAVTNLTLQDENVADCPANYDGSINGAPPSVAYTGIAGNIASWATIPSMSPGDAVTFLICGVVGGALGENTVNEARVSYVDSSMVAKNLVSSALTPISNNISGTVYHDTDSSGNFSPMESGIPAVLVELYVDANSNGILDAGETTVHSTTFTASDGYYEFTSSDSGDYIVVETNPSGYTSTGDVDNAPLDCTPSATNNGCDTIGGGGALGNPSAITISVTDGTDLINLNFFDLRDAPDLRMVKTDSPDPVARGETLTYTLTVSNNGNLDATGVVIKDVLPGGVTWVSTANSNIGTACTTDAVLDCDCSQPDGTQPGGLVCQMGTIAIGATETVTINVTVD